MPDFLRHQF